MTDERIKKLNKIAEEEEYGNIRGCVAHEALDHAENSSLDNFFSDLFQNGCVSGMISCLIYCSDINAFFDDYYHEIEKLRMEFEESTGEKLSPRSNDLKTYFAWFAFEETARILADELEE